ncbi:MAG: DUF2207 domain-containing protein, partial [Bdellovibrionales bacterium]|nr:DUF2207 domain-containing protein [Bdellovibrionales bacterium]
MCGNLCRSLFYPFLLVCFVLHGRSTLAQYEEILRFESSITVRADSVLLVEERIRVNALGTKIEHFINRDFPIATRDRWGFRYRVNIEFLEVLRDGVPEPYTVETLSGISVGGFPGGKRLRMGKENIDISPGEHEYTIKYKTFPQIRYFEDYDELLWNVTGNDWDFPIRHAIARVTFPRQIPLSEVHPSGFTGKAGVSGSAFKEYRLGADKSIFMFETTAPLAEHESLTLSMTFPKGFLWEPTSIQKRNWWIESNPGQLYALGGLILVTFFYLGIWLLVGKDPFSGTMIPRYRPPDGLSAGDTRYLSKMGFDRDVLTAEILHLATRGALRISYDDTDEFALTKVSPCEVELSTTDENLLNALFGNDEVASLRVAESNSSTFLQAQNTLKKNLSAKYLRYHFLKNMKFFVVGLLLSIGTLWISAWKESYEPLSL